MNNEQYIKFVGTISKQEDFSFCEFELNYNQEVLKHKNKDLFTIFNGKNNSMKSILKDCDIRAM